VIRYPLAYNPILEYWGQIESKKVVVPDSIYQTYKHLVWKVENPGKYFYSSSRANHFFEFAENYCRLSQGKKGFQLVELELWEKAFLGATFGFIDEDGVRQYQEVCLIIGKKNGKSLIASLVGNYMLSADGEAGPEVYSVATKKDQAKKIWLPAKQMVLQSPILRKRIKPLVSSLYCAYNFGEFKYLSSDADTLDGLNIHCVLMDELQQWKNGMALYNIMSDGMSAREQPLCLITTTAGTVREDIYDEKYDEYKKIIRGYQDGSYVDERRIGFIYELDNREEWKDEKCWQKANPGIGTIKNINDLREKVKRAKENPKLVKNLLCKEFNIRETSEQAWLSFDTIVNESKYNIKELKPRYGIIGLDLSDTTDLTCATVLFKVPMDDTVYVKQMYWLPADRLDEHIKTDKVPYDIWLEQGWIRICEGNRINYHDVMDWFNEVNSEDDIYFYKAGYDSWNAKYIVDEIEMLVGKEGAIPVIQGPKTFSSPLKYMEAELKAKKVNYDNNPILRWCFTNAKVNIDRNENLSLVKTSVATRRIDGVASLMDAFIVYENNKEDYLSMI
jgi:phage terminase large subunit-like protein